MKKIISSRPLNFSPKDPCYFYVLNPLLPFLIGLEKAVVALDHFVSMNILHLVSRMMELNVRIRDKVTFFRVMWL
jgi:hypothetical protein